MRIKMNRSSVVLAIFTTTICCYAEQIEIASAGDKTYAGMPMIVAHRGASQGAPDNTIPAFMLAWEQGADAIEGDFYLTKDGHIVCTHDRNTKRVSNTNLVVNQSTLAELKMLDVGVHSKGFKDTRIPTIAEVFATIPEQKKIYIEVKCGTEIIPALLREIDKSGLMKEQIIVISYNEKVIQELKAKAPQYKAYWVCAFKKHRTGEVTPSLEKVLSTLKLIQADGLSSNRDIPQSVIEAVRQQGYEWNVWVIYRPETANRMAELGAKSLTTNSPGFIRKHLVSASLSLSPENSQ